MMKQDSNQNSNSSSTTTTVCGQCGIEERKFLHNVRLRGNFRRLCTNCVLRLHPQCFCPACLGVYERSPPDDAVVCYKCYSSSHPTCVISPPAGTMSSSRGPSPCSVCINPNSLVLNLNRIDNARRAIDVGAARLLLAAAKIAAMSMNKAEVAAAMEAERRSKEAAYTKRRAREALDHVVKLMVKGKRNVGVESNNSYKKVINVNNSGVVIGVSNVGNFANVVNNKTDASNEVLEALNAVELKENGVAVEGIVNEGQGNGVVGMEVDGVVNGKDVGVNSIVENGCVKTDALVCNGQEPALEKVNVVEENGVMNPNL